MGALFCWIPVVNGPPDDILNSALPKIAGETEEGWGREYVLPFSNIYGEFPFRLIFTLSNYDG